MTRLSPAHLDSVDRKLQKECQVIGGLVGSSQRLLEILSCEEEGTDGWRSLQSYRLLYALQL